MSFKVIPVTHDKGSKRMDALGTMVDAADHDEVIRTVSHRRLRVSRNGYVYWNDSHGKHYLHRWLLRAPDGLDVDHINDDRLDNRRENLQLCTRGQNMMKAPKRRGTKSKYRGLSWDSSKQRWKVQISVNGRNIFVGRFIDEMAAARAYDEKAKAIYGKFVKPNFPEESDGFSQD